MLDSGGTGELGVLLDMAGGVSGFSYMKIQRY